MNGYLILLAIAFAVLVTMGFLIWIELADESDAADKAKHQAQLEKDDEEDVYRGL